MAKMWDFGSEAAPTNIHVLKQWPGYFNTFLQGRMLWDFRQFDRNFESGDLICFREFHPEDCFTGRMAMAQISQVWDAQSLNVMDLNPIRPDYCILSLRRVMMTLEHAPAVEQPEEEVE